MKIKRDFFKTLSLRNVLMNSIEFLFRLLKGYFSLVIFIRWKHRVSLLYFYEYNGSGGDYGK